MSGSSDASSLSALPAAISSRSGADAAAAAVDALSVCGYPLSSVYLIQGDRLRCFGVGAYGQIYDGMLPDHGVIGRAFSSGAAVRVRISDSGTGYLAAADGVEDELALPLLHEGSCVGVLNIESREPIPHDDVQDLCSAATALSDALFSDDGPTAESRSQRLVRHASSMAGCDSLTELSHQVLEAALDLSGLESAFLVIEDRVLAALGPAAPGLTALPPAELSRAVAWVATGSSSRTSGHPTAAPSQTQSALADAGLTAFVIAPLGSGSDLFGAIVVGGQGRAQPGPQVVEAIELLAVLATADIRSLQAADVLRRQARTDDLTGLPHRRAFADELDKALGRYTAAGVSTAVLLVDLDGFKLVNDERGHQAGDQLLTAAASAFAAALRGDDAAYRIGGDEFAVIACVTGPQALGAIAERLLAAARSTGVSVSIGGAIASDGQDPDELVRTADVRLYAAKRSGRDRAELGSPTQAYL